MLVAQYYGRMKLVTQQAQKLSLSLSTGYKQMSDKPNHVVNNSISCIDHLFCANQNTVSNYGVSFSIFDVAKIFCGKIKVRVPLRSVYVREVWD